MEKFLLHHFITLKLAIISAEKIGFAFNGQLSACIDRWFRLNKLGMINVLDSDKFTGVVGGKDENATKAGRFAKPEFA